MSRSLDSVLALAERAVTVADLVGGQELWCVEPGQPAVEVAKQMRERNYDVAPVGEEPVRRYVHVADAEDHPGTVADAARPIDVGLLVSSSLSLADAVADLGSRPYLFVLERNRVTHLLTCADLQLPPVSLVALGFVTAAESALDHLIGRQFGERWPELLTAKRRVAIEAVFAERRRHNAETTLLDCLNLDDRLAIARKADALRVATGSPARRQFDRRAEAMKRLRNVLAHGGGLLDAEPEPSRAVVLFADVRALAESAWAAVEHDDDLLDAFARTSIRLLEPPAVLAGDGAVPTLPLLTPVHVITACNPSGRIRSGEENGAVNTLLEARLRDLGVTPVPAVGWAGEWSEDSFAVSGLSTVDACALGAEFGQAALFEVTADEVRVVHCATGVTRRRRPRRFSGLLPGVAAGREDGARHPTHSSVTSNNPG